MKPGESDTVISICSSIVQLAKEVVGGRVRKLTLASISNKFILVIEKAISASTETLCCQALVNAYIALLPAFVVDSSNTDKVISFIMLNADGSSGEARKICACKVTGALCADKLINSNLFMSKLLERSVKSCQVSHKESVYII